MTMEQAHHDGSSAYVTTTTPTLGDTVRLRLWTRSSHQPAQVVLRTVTDGEPLTVEASVESQDESVTWWSAALPMTNPSMHYRWLLVGGAYEYQWITAAGTFDFDVPDATDFIISIFGTAPSWSTEGVVYQIYPDRFARAESRDQLAVADIPFGASAPAWIEPRAWTARPDGRSKHTPFEYFGGDLIGARERLNYIQELGASAVYFTPIFPAGSTHRYDASTFDAIDPLLGGESALGDFIADCHARGLKVIGDITLNHCGVQHPWFAAAKDGRDPECGYFTFDEGFDYGYACWWNVPSLPKFDHSSMQLREELITGSESSVRKWLTGPQGFDGWRVDVANMAGRLGDIDLTHEVARDTRRTMDDLAPDLLLVAEHGHDASDDLAGDGWHGTMNYAGFTRQVWCWLRSPAFDETFMGLPVEIPSLSGRHMVASMRAFHGRIPWQQLRASWNILSSHDTARIRTVVGSHDRQVAAIALAVGLPGVPMVFAGDEIGVEGWWGEDGRVPFPWHDQESWDSAMLQVYRTLLTMRRHSPALHSGGLRWIHVEDDAVAFLRESPDQRLLVAVSRDQCAPLRFSAAELDWESATHRFGFEGKTVAGNLVLEVPHAGASIWELS